MDSYSVLIFLHILGATGVFAAWGIEAIVIRKLRQAVKMEEARMWLQLFRRRTPLGPVSMIVILATGIWMMATRWGHQLWMMLAFIAMVLIAIIGVTLSRRAISRFKPVLSGEGNALPDNFYAIAGTLTTSLRIRLAIGILILGLMTFKP